MTLTWWRNGNNDLPNLFQQWGGGEMADQVKANPLMDISDVAKDEIASVVGSVAGWQVNGKTYGLPWSLGVVGFWCNKAFFTQAGIAPTLVTLDNTRWTTAVRETREAGPGWCDQPSGTRPHRGRPRCGRARRPRLRP